MLWTTSDYGTPRVEMLYGVRLCGYPDDLTYDAPTRFGRTDILERLLGLWRDGSIYFCTADALWRLTAAAPLQGQGSR